MLTGSELRFEIFKDPEDYVDWNKYIDYFKREPAFGKEKSEDLVRVYLFLKDELGKEYLKKPFKDGRDLVNSWLWSRGDRYAELKWLSESLEYFKKVECNYKQLLGKLRSAQRCNTEGVPFIIIGDSLRKAGFDIVFEPETDFSSKPDIKIACKESRVIVYGEVSYQDESVETELKKDTYFRLVSCFNRKGHFTYYSGKIHDFAKSEILEKIGGQILEIKATALENKSLIVVSKGETQGIIEFVVAHKDKLKELEEHDLTKKHKLNCIEGQGLNIDYTSRILSKVKEKIKQHTSDHPLIVYVQMDQLFYMLGLFKPELLITNIKRTLSDFPNAMGVCLFVTLGEETDTVEEIFDNDYLSRKMIFDRNAQFVTLFIGNDKFLGTISKDTINKFIAAFRMMCQ